MTHLFLPLPGNEALAGLLAAAAGGEIARADFHRFPDGESKVRIDTDVAGRALVLVCTLDRPDEKFLPLIFAAETARELGAVSVVLVAPYLGYMRQDARFAPGEAVTSRIFARKLSQSFDRLITVDPHLHRWHALGAIYDIPAEALHAGPLVAAWLKENLPHPFLVGPDEESEQWVGGIAAAVSAPHTVVRKLRRGDTDVEETPPDLSGAQGRTPVLVDDIIASGRTMIEAARRLKEAGARPPVCVGVHAVFAGDAYPLLKAVAARIVTTNTIAHETNAIDVSTLIAKTLPAAK